MGLAILLEFLDATLTGLGERELRRVTPPALGPAGIFRLALPPKPLCRLADDCLAIPIPPDAVGASISRPWMIPAGLASGVGPVRASTASSKTAGTE